MGRLTGHPIAHGLVALLIGALAGVILAGTADAGSPGPPGGQAVAEQNLDEDGLIRVHEQGTADVTVTNDSLDVDLAFPDTQDVNVTNTPLPVTGDVTADVSGSSVSVSDPVDVAGPVEVTGSVEVEGGSPGFRLTETQMSLCAPCEVGVESAPAGALSGPVTSVSFFSDKASSLRFAKGGDSVHTIFVGAGETVNVTFPHPLDADGATITCPPGERCRVRYAIAGYSTS